MAPKTVPLPRALDAVETNNDLNSNLQMTKSLKSELAFRSSFSLDRFLTYWTPAFGLRLRVDWITRRQNRVRPEQYVQDRFTLTRLAELLIPSLRGVRLNDLFHLDQRFGGSVVTHRILLHRQGWHWPG